MRKEPKRGSKCLSLRNFPSGTVARSPQGRHRKQREEVKAMGREQSLALWRARKKLEPRSTCRPIHNGNGGLPYQVGRGRKGGGVVLKLFQQFVSGSRHRGGVKPVEVVWVRAAWRDLLKARRRLWARGRMGWNPPPGRSSWQLLPHLRGLVEGCCRQQTRWLLWLSCRAHTAIVLVKKIHL